MQVKSHDKTYVNAVITFQEQYIFVTLILAEYNSFDFILPLVNYHRRRGRKMWKQSML